MNALDLAFTSALEQAQLIRKREISPLEKANIALNDEGRVKSEE